MKRYTDILYEQVSTSSAPEASPIHGNEEDVGNGLEPADAANVVGNGAAPPVPAPVSGSGSWRRSRAESE